jgi:hypothetical protein
VGGGIDVAVGGASFGTGLLIGALAGGAAAAYYSVQNLATVRTLWSGFRGDRMLAIGPHRNPNFPWVLLDRALLHWSSVAARAHARRDPLTQGPPGIVLRLSDDVRAGLGKDFALLRKGAPRVTPELEASVVAWLARAVDELAVEEERGVAGA